MSTFRNVVCMSAVVATLAACDGGDATTSAPAPESTSKPDPDEPEPDPDEPEPEGPVSLLFAPIGTRLDVALGDDALTARIAESEVPAEQQPTAYYFSEFQFESALDADASYSVSLGEAPANQSCRAFMGESGTGDSLMPRGAIRVGCEWSYDYLSRSSDSSAFGAAKALAIGGANESVGETEALGEGRFVVFLSSIEGLAGNDNGYTHVFWRDRSSGITRLVSHAPDGTQGDESSSVPAISADGLSVIFRSSATNLVADDTNEVADIFVWSALDDSVVRVSAGPTGEEATSASDTPTLSGDGSIVAFVTNDTTIAPDDNDGSLIFKVVRIDRKSGERTIVSRHRTTGFPADGGSPMLSEDGQRLVFQSFRDTAGDINTYAWDIFVYDHDSGAAWSVTLTPDGGAHDGEGSCVSCGTTPAISGDGKWVTFADGSTNLSPSVSDGLMHYWLVEVDACSPSPGTCHVVPVDMAADGSPADVASPTRAAPLSYDGRYVSFASLAANLGAPQGTYQQRNVFVFDRESASSAKRVTPVTTITEAAWGAEERTALSRSGTYVVFEAAAHLDPRIDSGGTFAGFTGYGDAFAWYRGPLE